MNRAPIIAAAGLLLATYGWMEVSARRNRTDTPGGTLELTERELRLVPRMGDSTAIQVVLQWQLPAGDPETPRTPRWLGPAKLAGLGVDCRVPATSPNAPRHYGSAVATPVWLVLELAGPAWQNAPPERQHGSRLFVVDASQDPQILRGLYPDRTRYLISRGLMRARLQLRHEGNSTLLPEPRLVGQVVAVEPGQIFVPRPYGQMLAGLRPQDFREGEAEPKEPRYAVTVAWGKCHEPWVQGVRLLGAAAGETKPRQ